MRISLLAVIVAVCASAFASPSLARPNNPTLFEGRASLDTRHAGARAFSDQFSRQHERAERKVWRRAALRGKIDRDRLKASVRAFGAHSGGARVVALAERYLGTNPTRMGRLWCANFLGMIEQKAGRKGTGSNLARSYINYGSRVAQPQPGDIAVLGRGKRGGHVGYFVGWAGNGKAILISGNSRGGKVSKGQYAANRVLAWRRPA